MKIYHGERANGTTDPGPVTVTVDGETYPLKPQPGWYMCHLGWAWGYYGSGPKHLAYALLVDATGDRGFAELHHQSFKDAVISQLGDTWELTQAAVLDDAVWIAHLIANAIPEGSSPDKVLHALSMVLNEYATCAFNVFDDDTDNKVAVAGDAITALRREIAAHNARQSLQHARTKP